MVTGRFTPNPESVPVTRARACIPSATYETKPTTTSRQTASTPSAILNIDENVVALDLYRKRHQRHYRRQRQRVARFYVERRTMAWTDDALALELALIERSAIVRAHVLDAENLSVDVAEQHLARVRDDAPGGTRGDLGNLRNPMPRHARIFLCCTRPVILSLSW